MSEFETELKFNATPAMIARVKEDASLLAKTAAQTGEQRLITTYFDSPKRKLSEKGAILRIRQSEGRYIQTVKAEGDRGGLVRPEFEEEIAGPIPDLTHLADSDFAPLIAKAQKDGALQPLFSTDIVRETRLLVFPGGTRIEMAFDTGQIVAGKAGEPVCEIELELKAGSAATLFSVAQVLSGGYGASLSLRSKAQRGLGLSSGKPQKPVKAAMPILPPKIRIGEALALIAGECLKHLSANEGAVRAGKAEGVHQMRVALRRLRSALKIFSRIGGGEVLEALEDTAKTLAGEMGKARDLDVFVEEIVDPAIAHLPGGDALEVLLKAIGDRREAAWAGAMAVIDGAVYRDFVLACAELAVCGPAGLRAQTGGASKVEDLLAPLRPFAEETLARRYKKVRKRGRKLADLSAMERHELRKDLKKLRYGAEFFASLFSPKDQAKFFAGLKKLQDDLGYLNDVVTARALLEEVCRHLPTKDKDLSARASYLAGEIVGWHMNRADAATSDLHAEWAALEKTPKFWQGDG